MVFDGKPMTLDAMKKTPYGNQNLIKRFSASIMASATLYALSSGRKHLKTNDTRHSRTSAIALGGRKWPMR
jgi:hypothetical protein